MADQNVTINLAVQASGDAARQMQNLAEQTRKAQQAQQEMARTGVMPGIGGAGSSTATSLAQQQARDGIQAQKQLTRVTQEAAQQYAVASQKVSTAAQAMTSAVNKPGSGGASASGSQAADALGSGGGTKLFGIVAAVMGAIRMGQAIMQSATGVAAARNDPTVVPELRERNAREQEFLVGSLNKTVREYREASNGTTGRIKLLGQEAEIAAQAIQAMGQAAIQTQALEARNLALQAKDFALNRDPELTKMAQMRDVDRTTVRGEREFLSEQRRLPLAIQARSAEAGARGAGIEAGWLAAEERKRERDFDLAQQRVAGARTDAGKARGVENRARAAYELQQALQDQEQKLQQLMASRERLGQAMANQAQAESVHRKALIALERERLQTLTETEQRIKGQAQAFGQLTAVEKMSAMNAVDRLKKQGLAALSGEERALIQRAGGGDFLAKEVEKNALADPRFKQFQEMLGEQADLRQVQKQRVQLENKVAVDIQIDEAKLAEGMREKMVPVLERLKEDLLRQMGIKMEEFRNQIFIRNLFQ